MIFAATLVFPDALPPDSPVHREGQTGSAPLQEHTHTRTHTRARTHTRTHMHAHTHTHTHAHMHTHTRTHNTHTHKHEAFTQGMYRHSTPVGRGEERPQKSVSYRCQRLREAQTSISTSFHFVFHHLPWLHYTALRYTHLHKAHHVQGYKNCMSVHEQ